MDRLQLAVARAQKKREANTKVRAASSLGEDIDFQASTVQAVSAEKLASNRIVTGLQGNAESQIFKRLRTKVLAETRANGWQTIAISSPKHGQGKSTVVANLAVAMSMELAQSVLIVDLDLQRPNLHRIFGLEPEFGLADIVRGNASIKQTMVSPGIERLAIIPGSSSIENSSETMSDPVLLELFERLKPKNKSKFVIYDIPALLHSDDALKTIEKFDCSLLVLEDGKNTADEIRQSIQAMKKTNYLGYVINKSGGFPGAEKFFGGR